MTLLTNTLLISINNPASIFWEIILYVCICTCNRYNSSSAAQDIHTCIHVHVYLEISMAKVVYGNQHVSRFLRSNLGVPLGVSVSVSK